QISLYHAPAFLLCLINHIKTAPGKVATPGAASAARGCRCTGLAVPFLLAATEGQSRQAAPLHTKPDLFFPGPFRASEAHDFRPRNHQAVVRERLLAPFLALAYGVEPVGQVAGGFAERADFAQQRSGSRFAGFLHSVDALLRQS